MGEAVEKNWEDNENVAIIDFLDDVGQPYSCFQWGIFDDDDLPTIINDGNYNLIFNHSPEINFKFYLGKSSFKDPQKLDENDVMLKKKLKKISESKKSYLHNFKIDNQINLDIMEKVRRRLIILEPVPH